ncbi:NAD-dependent epimerase/dehydratase family protein [Natronobacterium gregoryi]|uniref:Epimerase n=2 Tax=Natronobacterium gregoryi TaxID=44930 RepID=L0ALS4_NATGS|nr:NAD-dependent epimerase/dehydratase family protein [Natronobacterium gregoryi]AFZ74107.1 nucleoside-diphosphate-sugar epimerase [Natronobacterium gregoryi SP2]ELY63843.1 NAD-dependent epimerase/dehydratase [Natronobacterium gregoryi SP2]PLK18715.1 epimerase [Natronobacterium gregoryi SP2]SFJ66974.1 dihydroflavonol-4-reductase [Natronobacterium gregoryi]
MTKTAAVTGATGFLGTHLCERLLEDGWDVRGLSRPNSDRGRLAPRDVEWHVGDLFDEPTLRSLVDGADAVFHLAGIGLWNADPDAVERVNRDGTANVVSACRGATVGRLVFTSTAGTRRPPEEGVVADETDVAEPIGAYQKGKAAAEELVDRYAADGGDAVTVHPTSVFGPGDDSFTAQLLTMGLERTMPAHLPGGLSIVGVDDVVDGLVLAYEEGEPGEHYILGGENLTYEQAVSRIASHADGSPARIQVPATAIHAAGPVAETVGAVTNRHVFPFSRGMARLATSRLFYSSRKAHEELGYEYEPLEAHLPETLEWYRTTVRG